MTSRDIELIKAAAWCITALIIILVFAIEINR